MSEAIHESWDGGAFSESRVEGAMIQNVKLLGRVSRNGRTYSDRAMDDAARLYEGVAVYFDHPTDRELRERKGVRSVRDLAGKVRNPRRIGHEVRGDIQAIDFGEAHSPLRLLKAFAEQMPDAVGFSHRASGSLKKGPEGDVVESLDRVFAHELVTDPATTEGLFESLQALPEETEMELKDLTLAQLKEARADLIAAVRAEIQESEEITALRAENKRLKDAAEIREKADAEAAHKAMIETKLGAAKLPDVLVTETFRGQLEEAKDEAAVDALIKERTDLAKSLKPSGPRSFGRDLDESRRRSGEPEPVTAEVVESAVETLFI